MDLQYSLEKLGFSAIDASIYLALLKVGESPVGPIIAETGHHRDLVYGAFTRLEKQGLIQAIEKKKIRHYQALNPDVLQRKLQAKADLAAQTLPALNSIYTQPAVSVVIYEGSEGLEEIEKDWAATLKDNEEFYCIGGAGKEWYETAKSFYKPYHQKLYKRGIRAKTITYADEVEGIRDNELPDFNPLRVLPKKFKVPSSTVIYGNKILLQIFGENFIGIVIESKAISESYRQYFDLLWAMGKEIEQTP